MTSHIAYLLQKVVQDIKANDLSSATFRLNEILKVDKSQPDALRFMGVVAALQKRWDQALGWVDLALKASPQNGFAYSNRGNILIELGRQEEALSCYEKAIALEPLYAEAYSNQGNALQALGRYQEALASYEKAVKLDPNHSQTFYGVARLFSLRMQLENALGCCDQALRINPRYEEAQILRGDIFFQVKDYENAIAAYDKALILNPNDAHVWISKGHIYAEMKEPMQARTAFLNAFEIAPNTDGLLGTIIQNNLHMCKWDELALGMEKLIENIHHGKNTAIPYNLITLVDDRVLIRRSIEIYTGALQRDIFRKKQKPLDAKKKIRLGYFSADFHDHPTAHLVAELFECHDKEQFELVAFVFGRNAPDAMRSRLENAFNQFIDINGTTDEEAANLSREMEIDIAIDLKGLTEESRPKVFMHGAAPIQISYLAFPGTMGNSCYDYVVADHVVIPEEYKDGMVEKIIYMPNSYQVNDRNRHISATIKTREELGLPCSGFVFCCFNNNYKILPSVLGGWIRILNAVDESVLWLFADNPFAVAHLKKEVAIRGLNPDRIIFAGRIPSSEHIGRYQLADLFLDTFPCNAHTTASDALWAGLPVLTLAGKSFATRVAASLLNAIGLADLVVNSQQEYESLAIELATHPEKLQVIKNRLKQNLLTAPLFDTPLFTKNLESAYIEIYKRHQQGVPPEHIYIS